MIWDERDQQAMRRIFGQVWVTMRLAPPHPVQLHPHPRHQSRALGLPKLVPVIRSWLGVGPPTPRFTPHFTHSAHSLKDSP